MKHCRTVKLFFGVSLALLSGCASVGPEPRLLADELQYAETVKNLYKADGNWWLRYNDPELNNLIETALANNPDYLKAAFNVEKELARPGPPPGRSVSHPFGRAFRFFAAQDPYRR